MLIRGHSVVEGRCQAEPKTRRHTKNTYASETPLTDGKYVFASFGSAGLYAVDFQGTELWKRDLGLMRGRAGWGTSSSPILFQNTVIVNCDSDEDSYITALDKATGDPVWRTERDEGASWGRPFCLKPTAAQLSSPTPHAVCGVTTQKQAICCGSVEVRQ